jgi:hypothetical protein
MYTPSERRYAKTIVELMVLQMPIVTTNVGSGVINTMKEMD